MTPKGASEIASRYAFRNLWIHAWRTQGLQVSGGWWISSHLPGATAHFRIVCGVEGCGGRNTPVDILAVADRDLRRLERAALLGCCPHLAPLRGPTPPEIRTLYQLLLLENPTVTIEEVR